MRVEPQARRYNKAALRNRGGFFWSAEHCSALPPTLFLTVAGGTVICARCHDWNSAINDLFVVLASVSRMAMVTNTATTLAAKTWPSTGTSVAPFGRQSGNY
jgi:hypothetical protein